MRKLWTLKKLACALLSALLATGLAVGCWAGGYVTAGGPALPWMILFSLTLALLLAALVGNLILSRRFTKRMQNMTAQEGYELSKQLQSEVEQDYRRAEQSVNRTVAWSYAYLAALILLFGFFCFCVGRLGFNLEGNIFSVTAACFFLWGFFQIFTEPSESPVPEPQFELSPDRFPLLAETVRRAARDTGCGVPVRFFLTNQGIAINEHRGTALILLDAVECSLLTREEIYNIMLHEFAHILHVDVARSRRFGRLETKWTGGENSNGNPFAAMSRRLYLSYPTYRMAFAIMTYTMVSSRYHEIEADELVKRCGDPQTYIDATAKAAMLALYNERPQREMAYDFYADEQPPKDFAQRDVQNFYRYRERYGDRWRTVLRRELPARVDSHPTLRMRMEHMGCDSFDDTTLESDAAFGKELDALRAEFDLVLYCQNKDYYAQYRKENYLDRRERMLSYERAVAEGKEPGNDELVQAMQAYYGIDEDKVEAIADGMLAKDPDSAYAHFFKGCLLYDRGDEGCLTHFYAATGNYNLAESAVDYIGKFALKSGRQELLDEYRAKAPGLVQTAFDHNKRVAWRKSDRLRESELPPARVAELTARIRELGRGKLQRVYTATYGRPPCHPFVLVFADKVSPQERYEITEAVFQLLDRVDNTDFNLFDARFNRRVYKQIRAVPGALVYERSADSAPPAPTTDR